MSIVTKTGDHGQTALMYSRRVPKSDARIEACGAVDELNAVLGLVRSTCSEGSLAHSVLTIQGHLVPLMGELATATEDLPRYIKDGFQVVVPEMTAELDRTIQVIEPQSPRHDGWATPGANPTAATLDLARAVCRRAERRACALQEIGQLRNSEIIVYLNRLSDLLWLFARVAETK